MEIHALSAERIIDRSQTMYPSVLRTWINPSVTLNASHSHFYGVVTSGEIQVSAAGADWCLKPEMYFSLPGPLKLKGRGALVSIERIGYRGLAQCGGPLEESGRLVYIDHCHTTLLVPPARSGDPVFNLLVFPPLIRQSLHIHPSIRMGLVLRGSGKAVLKNKKIPLKVGSVFCLEEQEMHCFHSGPKGLSIIAYHPDSDWGPVDTDHPMLNRTYTVSRAD